MFGIQYFGLKFSEYLQISLADTCKFMITFTCKFGSFSFGVMSLGLINAPMTFQMKMNELL